MKVDLNTELYSNVYILYLPHNLLTLQKLQEAYHQLDIAYSKIVEVMDSGKRMLGNFFRVTFYGQVSFSKYM